MVSTVGINVSDIDEARQDFLSLREKVLTLQIASVGTDNIPLASYAPFVWHDNACYMLLSDLAEHTPNLRRNPAISLMLIEPENEATNPFARKRILLQGRAAIIARDDPLYTPRLSEFQQRFGNIVEVIATLADFHLFQVRPESGRFVRGFGQAYQLCGESLDQLNHIDPAKP